MQDEKTIITLYQNDNLTIRQIAEQLECGYETIRKILKKNDVPWKRKYACDFTPNQIQDIISQFQDGTTIKQIAPQYGISAPAISRLLKANGIQVISSLHKYDDLRLISITNIQKQIIVGSLLGDGCVYRDTERSNYKLSFGHCEAQKEYFDWKMSLMQPFITHFSRSIDKRQNSIMWQTATISHPDINSFGDSFYDPNRVKIIPPDLDQYITPLTLAIWIMDDGSLNSVNMRIATMSFTEQEHYILQDYMYRIFGLKSKVIPFSEYFQLCLDKENTQKLSDIIRPYVVSCMQYKVM